MYLRKRNLKCGVIVPDNFWEWGSEIYHSDATFHILFGILSQLQTDG